MQQRAETDCVTLLGPCRDEELFARRDARRTTPPPGSTHPTVRAPAMAPTSENLRAANKVRTLADRIARGEIPAWQIECLLATFSK